MGHRLPCGRRAPPLFVLEAHLCRLLLSEMRDAGGIAWAQESLDMDRDAQQARLHGLRVEAGIRETPCAGTEGREGPAGVDHCSFSREEARHRLQTQAHSSAVLVAEVPAPPLSVLGTGAPPRPPLRSAEGFPAYLLLLRTRGVRGGVGRNWLAAGTSVRCSWQSAPIRRLYS